MARKLDYRWHLRQVMAARGMFATTDLNEPLAQRGISDDQPPPGLRIGAIGRLQSDPEARADVIGVDARIQVERLSRRSCGGEKVLNVHDSSTSHAAAASLGEHVDAEPFADREDFFEDRAGNGERLGG